MQSETDGENDWYSDEAATFGDRMAGAREALGLTQAELARRMGVKLKTVRAWEEDLNEPRANKLQMLAGVLNVSIMWLLNGEGDGLDAPEQEVPVSPDMRDLLTEIRGVKSEMGLLADKLGRLEKKLRATLKEGM
ncbi:MULTISPECIES: helix-turn-helix domain-containing protein [Actibacterium]|uniref:Transcriptional regulator with XRE-family HTH domain n=1 Tax=Actibacterium naphthalenivorans TaxID=1614693 RepID=A0A840CF85_9RHOB|nr:MULTISPECIES: helix-turn-helix domain-containing protein [Actibacterium]ALG89492.1 XRE family transcriptional regulator [Actibacterium sp. EMB200-NS6]MBB4020867.1 transcriptional regulator with XRE-family HTH domain [Actibacterium naphthalenivorans]